MALSSDTKNRLEVALALATAGDEVQAAIDAATVASAPTGDLSIVAGVATLTPSSASALATPSPTTKIGYLTGAGGAVTQLVSRTQGVTLSKLAGQITTRNDSLAAEVAAAFIVTNTAVAIGDVVVVAIQSGSNGGNTKAIVQTVANGSFTILIANDNAAGGTAETGAIILNVIILKSVAA